MIKIFNKYHFPITVDKYIFQPFEEQLIREGSYSQVFRQIRATRGLRINKQDNDLYKKKHRLIDGNIINFCYDDISQHRGNAYRYVVESLARPILENLPDSKGFAGLTERPLKKMNCRFFNSTRIKQQGKIPVGPFDIFFSHGIGDKNYWIGKHIKDFEYAFVPGPAWEKRMRDTGYKGEIFICGYTKLDPIINSVKEKKNKKKKKILWMPTHGYSSKHKGRSSYPQCLELIHQISSQYDAELALHPTSKLNKKEKNIPTLEQLKDADVVIADAGSNIYEAWILGIPVILPDWICKKDVLGHFKSDKNNFEYRIYNEGIGYHAKDMKDLNNLIDIALSNGMKDKEIDFIESIYPSEIRGKAGELAASQLIEIAKIKKII